MDFDEKPGSSDAIQAILKGDFELVVWVPFEFGPD